MAKRPARRPSRRPRPPANNPVPEMTGGGRRELVLIVQPNAALSPTELSGTSKGRFELARSMPGISSSNVVIRPLFGLSEDLMRARTASLAPDDSPPDAMLPNLSRFYHVDAPDDRLDELAEKLRERDDVEAAYVKPAGEPPEINDMAPSDAAPPAATANFTSRQGYLDAAPGGIDARYAWTVRGGRGRDVRIIDCEWGWRFTHEDLQLNQGGVIIGPALSDDNHGTAVIGEISGDVNTFGVTGIAPEAMISAASFASIPTASVIRQAADRLRFGDILLLEIHRPGPRSTSSGGQFGFLPIEWWPDDYAAIRYAVRRGVIVVEAAGNGSQNLDDPLYNNPLPGFPATWFNPFNPANPSSEAVLVGAGAPPPGTHGANHGPDRSRLGFSNHGRRVDVQGWGREVTSTGYGDLQGGADKDRWYTDTFSGTSSASPIVVGALACIQGILRARSMPSLSPSGAIRLVRSTGSPQQASTTAPLTQRIGNRPDLRAMVRNQLGFTPDVEGDDTERVETNGDLKPRGPVINISRNDVTINITN